MTDQFSGGHVQCVVGDIELEIIIIEFLNLKTKNWSLKILIKSKKFDKIMMISLTAAISHHVASPSCSCEISLLGKQSSRIC